MDNNSNQNSERQKDIGDIKQKIDKIGQKNSLIHTFKIPSASRFLHKFSLRKKKAEKNDLKKTSAPSSSKLAIVKGHIPLPLRKIAKKTAVGNQIVLATYYRVRPKTRREKIFYFVISIFLLAAIGVSTAAGIIYGGNKFTFETQNNYQFNIPFYFGGSSLWKDSSGATKGTSSFGSQLHTHILIEYSYIVVNKRKKMKTNYTIIDLDKEVGYKNMALEAMPMDISHPFIIYVYNKLAGKDVTFHLDEHNVSVPGGKDVIKYSSDPRLCIYPSVYQHTDQKNITKNYTCNQINSSLNSAYSQTAYCGLPLYQSLYMPTEGGGKRKPVVIAKNQNPAFGLNITNYVNYYTNSLSFMTNLFQPFVPPEGILFPSLSVVINYYFPVWKKGDPSTENAIKSQANYSFDPNYYSQSDAFYWKTAKT